MRTYLILIALSLVGCGRSVEPIGWNRAQQLCEPSKGLSYLSFDGPTMAKERQYTAVCVDGTTIEFVVKVE